MRCVCGDLMELPLEDATVIAVYLLPEAISQVQPMLLACLERGARVVCNTWGMPPEQVTPAKMEDVKDKGSTRLWLYTKEGSLPVVAAAPGPEPEPEPASTECDT